MSLKLNSPFLGTPLGRSFYGKKSNGVYFDVHRGKFFRRAMRKRVSAEKQNDWIAQAIRFSHFCGQNIELFRKTIGLRNGFVAKSVKEPFAGSKALVRSLYPLWTEGLLLVRCSVLVAVMSGVCLLVWYGQKKAKGFVESKLLPSVCSVLSEYIQREIDFGKVKRVSPLSITLEASSIGPHSEEFSCGEVPNMKIRVLPFASLRRGKIVIDAVLSHPSLLVAQKKDFSWLGIPYSEDCLQRHLSTDEGIDYRTKSRRIAREEAATRWDRERDDEAKKAAEMGYIVSEGNSHRSEDDIVKEIGPSAAEITSSYSFSCMDEKMHWRDHHCVDTGVDYDTKHAELEKSFGVKIKGSGLTSWPKVIKGHKRNKFKKKFNQSDASSTGVAAKRRILERSASAALVYFQGLYEEDSGNYSEAPGYDLSDLNTLLVKTEDDSNGETSIDRNRSEGSVITYNQRGEQCEETENQNINDNAVLVNFNFLRDPFLMTLERLSGVRKIGKFFPYDGNATGVAKNLSCKVGGEHLVFDAVNRNTDENVSEGETSHSSPLASIKSDANPSAYHSVTFWPLGLKLSLPSFPDNMGEHVSNFLVGSFQKLKSGVAPKVEDIVAELVDEIDVVQTEGIEKMLPVTVDSVHFKGGTLTLLAFGDREARYKIHTLFCFMRIYMLVHKYFHIFQ